ncbi:MAG TPA: hypothetical protein VJ765_14900 [Chitinophagaceae bacterium]|nr:hypothetical protein [Chitinophagaceae bacterium]
MRLIVLLFLASFSLQAQEKNADKKKWRIDKNNILAGSLVFIGGATKGFNETLQFNYKIFEKTFPGANNQWFDPKVSWRNKYEGGNPDNGPKYFLSTSVFVMFTDQYHLNNFIHRAALMSALVIKIGEPKRPFKHYIYDLLFYTACYQAGFAAAYYPFTSRNIK